jgi:hypothetical protein
MFPGYVASQPGNVAPQAAQGFKSTLNTLHGTLQAAAAQALARSSQLLQRAYPTTLEFSSNTVSRPHGCLVRLKKDQISRGGGRDCALRQVGPPRGYHPFLLAVDKLRIENHDQHR